MAQHDYNIANNTAPNVRTDLNNALSAIVTQNAATTAPSTTFANMIWYDSTLNIVKMRNESNTGWIELFTLDQGSNLAYPSNIASQAEAEIGTNTTKMMTPQRVSQAIDALAPQILEGWHPYDMVTPGDGADGIFYDFSVNGAVNSIESPNFADGYEYMFRVNNLGMQSSYNVSLVLQLYLATSSTYTPIQTLEIWGISPSGIISISGHVKNSSLTLPRLACFTHNWDKQFHRHYGNTVYTSTGGAAAFNITTGSQKIGKVKFSSNPTANIRSGTIAMYRKKNYL